MREGMSAHDLSVDGGDARGRRVAIHMCIRIRWRKGTRAIATGDVRGRASQAERGAGRAAERASTGPRRTVHGGKVACGFQARAPESGEHARNVDCKFPIRTKGGGETCAGTRQKRTRRRRARVGRIRESLDRQRARWEIKKTISRENPDCASLIGEGGDGKRRFSSGSKMADPGPKFRRAFRNDAGCLLAHVHPSKCSAWFPNATRF